MRTNVVRVLADVVATKLGIVGANGVRAHEFCAFAGGYSGL